MLSYRHAFHAGNHADVLKHIILLQIAEYLGEKPAPFWIIDTHAGAGRYILESAHATKLGEYRDGVGRLLRRLRAGLLGGIVLATVPDWYFLAHQTMTDMPFVAPMTAAMGLVLIGLHLDEERVSRAFAPWAVSGHVPVVGTLATHPFQSSFSPVGGGRHFVMMGAVMIGLLWLQAILAVVERTGWSIGPAFRWFQCAIEAPEIGRAHV